MHQSMTRLETFGNLGYRLDPFKNGKIYQTGDMTRVARILRMAVASHAMMSVVGDRGCGKSEAIEAALKAEKCTIIRAIREDQENLRAPEIKAAMINKLSPSGESIRRGGVASLAQLRRVVGEAVVGHKQQVVLLIEEAQRLHPNTLKALKTLREMEWAGHKELFTIILVAQSNPMLRPGVSEVALRSDTIRMNGLSADEAAGYVAATVGNHFHEAALTALAELPAARNYLELQELCVILLNLALADGREQVTTDDVREVAGAHQAAALPKTAQKPAATAQVDGKSALASVLGRRTGTPSLDKGRDGEGLEVIHA